MTTLPFSTIYLRSYDFAGNITDHPVKTLIDSGSELTLISKNTVDRIANLEIEATPEIRITNAVKDDMTSINRKFTSNIYFPQSGRELLTNYHSY